MKYTIVPVLFAIALIAIIPNISAQETTQIDAKLLNNGLGSSIDTNAEIGDRLVRVYIQFTDFDIDTQNQFNVIITNTDTGNVAENSLVRVYSSDSGLIDFDSLVGYLVPEDGQAGNYQFEVSTKDGIISEPVKFTVYN